MYYKWPKIQLQTRTIFCGFCDWFNVSVLRLLLKFLCSTVFRFLLSLLTRLDTEQLQKVQHIGKKDGYQERQTANRAKSYKGYRERKTDPDSERAARFIQERKTSKYARDERAYQVWK